MTTYRFHLGLWEKIESSAEMLRLPTNYDGMNAEQVSVSAWTRAIRFLLANPNLFNGAGCHLSIPDITPCVDGGVDIHWENPDYEILINIPVDSNVEANYYGKCSTKSRFGKFISQGNIRESRFWGFLYDCGNMIRSRGIKDHCPQCGSEESLRREIVENYKFHYGVEELTATLPVFTCDACKFVYTDIDGEVAQEEAIKQHLKTQ